MTKYVLDKSFEERVDGIVRSKIDIVPTRYGDVFAFQNEIKMNRTEYTTVCPGFYNGELAPESSLKESGLIMAAEGVCKLPPERFFRVIDLLEIPHENRPGVEEDLRKLGYVGEFAW
jgi:hypothetical protein